MVVKGYCPSCFAKLENFEACDKCGFVLERDKRESYHLPLGTALKYRYIIGVVDGYGGLGNIYRAWDVDREIIVTVNELYPADLVTRQPGTCEVTVSSRGGEDRYGSLCSRFLDEARMLKSISGCGFTPNALDFFECGGTAYLVSEYVKGRALPEFLRENGGRLSFEDACGLTEPVMNGIEALHSKRLLHLGICPQNILLCGDGDVRVIIDVGTLSTVREGKKGRSSAVLAPGYAPPEAYAAKSIISERSDIYSLGATVYRILTGRKPAEAADRLREEALKRPSELGVAMPSASESALMKALSIEQKDRFRSVAEFKSAFFACNGAPPKAKSPFLGGLFRRSGSADSGGPRRKQ